MLSCSLGIILKLFILPGSLFHVSELVCHVQLNFFRFSPSSSRIRKGVKIILRNASNSLKTSILQNLVAL
uniref:Secreted protein n=1 Tax=Rhizophora mucronata TaxID=61149 RepID=A0A2P2NJA0_RHIMU